MKLYGNMKQYQLLKPDVLKIMNHPKCLHRSFLDSLRFIKDYKFFS